jgi:tRNA (guanine37-N1)-methyltransferase
MWVGVVTLFPEMFKAITDHGITSRAAQKGILQLVCWNPRDFTADNHKTVDDRPYGGGPGMLMKVQPLRDAINAAKQAAGGDVKVIYLSPQGKPLNQRGVNELATREKLIFVAGRYEGIDERLIAADIDEECSIGDYVISGGELAAMVVIDAITRLQPGAVGDEDSVVEDSFMSGLLDCPHYTRPEQLDDQAVPDVLLSGHHEDIKRWRLKQSLGRTNEKRPDLLEKRSLTEQEKLLLAEYLREQDEKKAQ